MMQTYTPAVRTFLPLFYVAWADGMLSPSEVALIHDRIDEIESLTESEMKQLKRWSDPTQWPSDRVFKTWLELIKEAAGDLDNKALSSLAEVGVAVGERAARAGVTAPGSSATESAIRDLQEVLGLRGLEQFRSVSREAAEEDPALQLLTEDIQRLLDGEHVHWRRKVRALLADPVFEVRKHPTKEAQRKQVSEWLAYLAEHGLGKVSYPIETGGQADIGAYAAVFETIALHDLSLAIKFGVHFGLFGGSILNLGTERHHREYLPNVGDLSLPGCFAMTETGHGSNVRDLETTAIYDPDTGLIDVHSPSFRAGKEYIGNALDSQMASVFAQLIVQGENHGVHAILVPIRDAEGQLLEGIRIEDNGYKMGLNGVDNGRIWFDHVKVPRENLLDRFGKITVTGRYESPIGNPSKRFFTMLGTLVGGRICVGKAGLSAAKVGLTIAVKYALHRRQFGPDKHSSETIIMDYPTHQRRLLPKLSKVYAAHFALEHLMKRYARNNEEEVREIETIAAGLKSYATWLATDTIQECREACGGKGYLWINRFADLKADSDIFATFEGDNTVLMQLVAKGLLGQFKDAFHEAGFLGVYRYLRSQATDSLVTINPIYKRKTDADHLVDTAFFNHAFRFRERKLLHTLSDRMRTMLKKRITPYDIFLRTQTHMVALAQAHVELVLLQQFVEEVDRLDGDLKVLMLEVLRLFALSTIEDHKGWYLEHDYMEGIKTKAIRRQVDRLCRELRQQVGVLVDGFGIPDGLIGAPIAFQEFS